MLLRSSVMLDCSGVARSRSRRLLGLVLPLRSRNRRTAAKHIGAGIVRQCSRRQGIVPRALSSCRMSWWVYCSYIGSATVAAQSGSSPRLNAQFGISITFLTHQHQHQHQRHSPHHAQPSPPPSDRLPQHSLPHHHYLSPPPPIPPSASALDSPPASP
jgi:hypothetical protein